MFQEPIATFIVIPMCCCAIGCQHSTLNRLFGSWLVVFSWYDVITCESSVHTFIRFFLQYSYFWRCSIFTYISLY